MHPAARTLSLHTAADGTFWYASDADGVRPTGIPAAEFQLASWDPYDRVQIMGTRANAPLIAAVRRRHPRLPVLLCSPLVCPGARLRDDPAAVLRSLAQPELSGRLAGQWKRLTPDDYCAYAFLALYDERPAPAAEVVRAFAGNHPAWPAITFVAGAREPAGYAPAYRLLAEIVEPRWFRHPARPHRPSRLHAHLGLTPENARAALGLGPPGRHHDRAAAAVALWYNDAAAGDPAAAPFPWPLFASQRTAALGLLKATKRVVELVWRVWEGRTADGLGQFDPRMFFAGDELRAYTRHAAATRPA